MNKINKLTLNDLAIEINNKNEIETKNKTIQTENITIIKRDGREEKYDSGKMKKVCLWACNNNENLANDLLNSTSIKIYEKIKISDVYDELIKPAANKISRLYPQFEMIAAKLLLLKI
ncbi:MAG: hypothetical protein K2L64_03525, partial [Ureaplasma sp.]|nr:hypothetical protein [Ureaplasma sp.]